MEMALAAKQADDIVAPALLVPADLAGRRAIVDRDRADVDVAAGKGCSFKQSRAEWKQAVAGTGQAVAFGMWGHTGSLQTLDPSAKTPSSVFAMTSDRREPADLRVRPATEPPSAPSAYVTNAGVVKVGAEGSRADLVRSLKVALASK